jgi:Flp pilus assembly protein TadG
MRRRRVAPRPRDQAGSALVEVAVLAPLLAALLFATSAVAVVVNDGVRMAGAVHAAAVYGSRSQSRAEDTAAIETVALAELGLAVVDASPGGATSVAPVSIVAERFCECEDGQPRACNLPCGASAPQMYLRVTAVKTVSASLALVGLPATIREEAVMRVR